MNLVLTAQTSIYEIQYTEIPGEDGYFPSPLYEQYLTTGGIVSGINYDIDHYFLSSSIGGAWNGIYVYDDDHFPAIGDSIIIYGQVWEYHGFTEIRDVSSFEVISSDNPLPTPTLVSTNDINTLEAYESALVKVADVTVFSGYDQWSEWQVDDGSGECYIATGFFNIDEISFPLILDYPFNSITGIVSYSWGDYLLHPRSISDFDSVLESYILSTNPENIFGNSGFEVPVFLSFLGESSEINSYQLDFQFDPLIVDYAGFDENGTLSENGDISDQINGNEVIIDFSGNFSFSGVESLINLNFDPLNSGDSGIELISANLNEIEVDYLSSGQIDIQTELDPIGDTLTVIMRPISNIPTIITPGEYLEVICLAPEYTYNWNAELIHNNYTLQLELAQTSYFSDLERYYLYFTIPEPEIFELFDLKITATRDIEDITLNAVCIIPEYKEDYYFAHITDTHLPTHYFYDNEESITDTSEIVDLREVIKDLNLINPEFVLLTGDLVNEGELEDFENRRYFTKAQRILNEFEVPVYLVAGNHDLGGWEDTPPEQGTARWNWWRFFGWKWLFDPPESNLYYTQNYSFDYGPIHFVGLESYVNYDYHLYEIYGYESFIPTQLNWLDNDLQNADSEAELLFYHYDFSDQIDLEELGVDMVLYGHIHHDAGDINSYPYNLATDNTCDEDRAYRLINVNGTEFDPLSTKDAGWNGNKLTIDYYPSNEGIADSVLAIVDNQHNQEFNNALIKFVMPGEDFDYNVGFGILEQVDTSGEFNICYVRTFLEANSVTEVSIRSVQTQSGENEIVQFSSLQIFPNPVTSKTTIKYSLENSENIKIDLFNLKGQFVDTISDKKQTAGTYVYDWDIQNLSSGIYFVKFSSDGFSQIKKCLIMK